MIKAEHDVLLHLFPDAGFNDWTLVDEGEGPYIAQWNRSEPIPGQGQINNAVGSAMIAAAKRATLQKISAMETQALIPRAVREFMVSVIEREAVAAGAARTPPLTPEQSIAVLRAGNSGYRKVKELDESIAVLRAKL